MSVLSILVIAMTTMQLLILSAQNATREVKVILRKGWSLYATFFFITITMNEFFLAAGRMGSQNESLHLMSQIGSLLTSLLETVFLILIIPHAAAGRVDNHWSSFLQNTKTYTLDLFIEGLRVLVQVLLWSLLLILPGIWRQIRLSFVPFIVLLSPRYHSEEFDALKESNRLMTGLTWPILGLTISFYVFDFALESVIRKHELLVDPVIPLLGLIIAYILQVWWMTFTTHIYLLREQTLVDLNQKV